jgi:hypothetical protein
VDIYVLDFSYIRIGIAGNLKEAHLLIFTNIHSIFIRYSLYILLGLAYVLSSFVVGHLDGVD